MDMETQPPEAQLIIDGLRLTRKSIRAASTEAGISEGRWRQIAKGYQKVSKDTSIPVTAPPDTLARMAHVVGVTPEQLEDAGRADAAESMRFLFEGPAEPVKSLYPEGGIQRLIADRRGTRSNARLSRDCGGKPTTNRIQDVSTNPVKDFPDADTIRGLSRGLNVSVTRIILAYATSLGLNVTKDEPDELVLQGAGALPPESKELLVNMSRQLQQVYATTRDDVDLAARIVDPRFDPEHDEP